MLLLTLVTLTATAYDFMVDGIAYNRYSDGKSVYVTFDGNYSGEIIIPEEVTNNGKTYSVTYIGDYAFSYCSKLTSVTIPNSVTAIGISAFSNCSGLTSVSIGNSVTYIGDHAFDSCIGLTGITIPGSVTYIGNGSFAYCSGLTSINIPSSVTHISMCLFYGDGVAASFMACPNLETITVESGNTKYDSRNNCNAIIETASNILITGCKNTTIPNTVTSIGDGAFYGSGLTSVSIPNTISYIGECAFWGCSDLTSITIPNSVTFIGLGALDECSSLTCITLIGQGSFSIIYSHEYASFPAYQFKTINIGSGITSVGYFGFAPEVVNCYAATPPNCDGTFSNYDGELHVPAASLIDYMTANNWKNFMNVNPDINERVTLDQNNATIALNETLQLEASALPNESELTWSTTKPGVATVDENGLVTAKSLGECDIYATLASNEAVYASCHITVTYPEIVSVTLSEHELQLNLGDSTSLMATTNPANTGPAPTWTTTDATVATVDANGLVKAVDVGECDIIVSVLDKSDTCHVTVSGNVIITLDQHELTVDINHVGTIVPTCTPIATDLVVTSSDPDVVFARLINGIVQVVGRQYGTSTVTVSSVDGRATPDSCVVTVAGANPGDVNGDGRVNVSDVTTLINMILGIVPTNQEAADVNGDGRVNVSDVTVIINIILGIS